MRERELPLLHLYRVPVGSIKFNWILTTTTWPPPPTVRARIRRDLLHLYRVSRLLYAVFEHNRDVYNHYNYTLTRFKTVCFFFFKIKNFWDPLFNKVAVKRPCFRRIRSRYAFREKCQIAHTRDDFKYFQLKKTTRRLPGIRWGGAYTHYECFKIIPVRPLWKRGKNTVAHARRTLYTPGACAVADELLYHRRRQRTVFTRNYLGKHRDTQPNLTAAAAMTWRNATATTTARCII